MPLPVVALLTVVFCVAGCLASRPLAQCGTGPVSLAPLDTLRLNGTLSSVVMPSCDRAGSGPSICSFGTWLIAHYPGATTDRFATGRDSLDDAQETTAVVVARPPQGYSFGPLVVLDVPGTSSYSIVDCTLSLYSIQTLDAWVAEGSPLVLAALHTEHTELATGSAKVSLIVFEAPLPTPPVLVQALVPQPVRIAAGLVLLSPSLAVVAADGRVLLYEPSLAAPWRRLAWPSSSTPTAFSALLASDVNGDGVTDVILGGISHIDSTTGVFAVAIAPSFAITSQTHTRGGFEAFGTMAAPVVFRGSRPDAPSVTLGFTMILSFATSVASVNTVRFEADGIGAETGAFTGLSTLVATSVVSTTSVRLVAARGKTGPSGFSPLLLVQAALSGDQVVIQSDVAVELPSLAIPPPYLTSHYLAGDGFPSRIHLYVVGLVNNDVEPDVVVVSSITGTITTFLNNVVNSEVQGLFQQVSGPSFDEASYGSASSSLSDSLVLIDVNSDAALDLIYVSSRAIFVATNIGGGSWQKPVAALDAPPGLDLVHAAAQMPLVAVVRTSTSSNASLAIATASSANKLVLASAPEEIDDDWKVVVMADLPGPASVVTSGPIGSPAGELYARDDVAVLVTSPNVSVVVAYTSGSLVQALAPPSSSTSCTLLGLARLVPPSAVGVGLDLYLVCAKEVAVWPALASGRLGEPISVVTPIPQAMTMATLADFDGNGWVDFFAVYELPAVLFVQPSPWAASPFPASTVAVPGATVACNNPSSLTCLVSSMASASRCGTNTLVFDGVLQFCRGDSHVVVTRPAVIRGISRESSAVACGFLGGILFKVSGGSSLVLERMSLRDARSVDSLYGAPPLRVDGVGSSLVLRDVHISHFSNYGSGSGTTMTVLGSGYGGVMVVSNGGLAQVLSSLIESCGASAGGGVAYISSGAGTSRLTIRDSDVVRNRALRGGALFCENGGVVEIVNATMAANSAELDGGMMVMDGDDSTARSFGSSSLASQGNHYDVNLARMGAVFAIASLEVEMSLRAINAQNFGMVDLPSVSMIEPLDVVFASDVLSKSKSAYGGVFFTCGGSVIMSEIVGWGNSATHGGAAAFACALDRVDEQITLRKLVNTSRASLVALEAMCSAASWGTPVATPPTQVLWTRPVSELSGTKMVSGFPFPPSFAVALVDGAGGYVVDSALLVAVLPVPGMTTFGGSPSIVSTSNTTSLSAVSLAATSEASLDTSLKLRVAAVSAASGTPRFFAPRVKCAGGLSAPEAAEGNYPTSDPGYFLKCPSTEACSGDGKCADGQQGRLCSECADGWFSPGAAIGECRRCKLGSSVAAAVFGSVMAGFLVLLSGYVLLPRTDPNVVVELVGSTQLAPASLWARLRAQSGKIKAVVASLALEAAVVVAMAMMGLAEVWEVAALGIGLVALTLYAVAGRPAHAQVAEAALKTTVVFLQTIGVVLVSSESALEESSMLKSLHGALERASLTVAGLACLGVGRLGEYWTFMALTAGPTAFCFGLGMLPGVGGEAAHRGVLAAGTLGYLFVFPIVQRSLAMFGCNREPTPGVDASYLNDAPWIRCGSSEHVELMVSGGGVLVCVACVIGCVARAAQVARAAHVHDAERESENDEACQPLLGHVHGVDEERESPLAFVWEPYREAAWWFEGVVLGRRVAIAAAAAIIPRTSVFVDGVLAGVVALGLFAHLQWHPLAETRAHRLEAIALTAVLAVIRLMTMLDEAEADTTTHFLSALILLVTMGVVSYSTWVVIVAL
ncbi:uncharacterized protein AMSG_06755 [Thecamonas trahens ATCC 50062]|uniref:DUF7630 domain-containing protein n=1 Tax=Thecamonas trahens ATCC 50062 TaxID=461836 RepID=A0A0L0DF50_THETB|nr:hypothetical protein AMSG_06755 [Thecamonas trahens ATCC 50062]KNC50850.1 hypothetical protein AMSG_06755 [Thecamonas trahens ATCC 50062]|eukprot:XP_013756803.1 hypothetical protein AMSG_06755 [Thecamonas trahens ATCC 50062]